MPKVRSGTKRRGWETGVEGNAWPMTPTRSPPTPRTVYGRREVGVAAHAPVARGQRREVEVGVRVGLDGSRGIVIGAEKLGAGEKRRTAALGADPEQRVRLAVEHGPQRRVGIREVQQRD